MTWKHSDGSPVLWNQVQAAIFDVDGTLYHQKPVRYGMAWRLLRYYLRHPARLRELYGIFCFRRIREEAAFQTVPLAGQIQEAARRARLQTSEHLGAAIQRWMFEEPLSLIARHGNQPILALLKELQDAGTQIIIYSDYPPEQKLSALHVTADYLFYPGKDGLTELKPSERCMQEILRQCHLPAEQLIYLGDREEKDGVSARMAGIPFLLVS